MKKVLITQRLQAEPSYNELRECLDVRWHKLLLSIGYLPVSFSAFCNVEDFMENVAIDGILLTGGNDLGHYSNNKIDRIRDKSEETLIRYGMLHSIPIMGVCRGMQVIANHFGSKLSKVSNHVAQRHDIIANSQSRFAKQLDKINNTNSYHEYGVTQLGKDLLMSAVSLDNTIEAIEHQELQIFGQMWHCEREHPLVGAQLELVKEFFG